MSELIWALGIAALVALGIYVLLENYEIFSAFRDAPNHPSSGVETAVGKPATALSTFSGSASKAATGRVRFEGEDWYAVFAGDPLNCPKVGDQVTIVEIDAAKLKVVVE